MIGNNQVKKKQTQLDQRIETKVCKLYQILIKLGCSQIKPVQVGQIVESMELFVQPTSSRLDLIEWLIATINPWYKQDSAYKNSYDDDPHLYKIKKLSISLWQLGVMPFSKHTRNLDYNKYVEGLLGIQNSVNLLSDLAELAESKFSSIPSHLDKVAGDLLHELIAGHEQLVDPNFDPYGITFPPKYFLQKTEEQASFINAEYEALLSELQIESDNGEISSQQQRDETASIFEEAEHYKQLFFHKYEQLATKIDRLSQKYEKISGAEADPSEQLDARNLHQSRMLNISKQFCQQYRSYKKLLSSIRHQNYDDSLTSSYAETCENILSLNKCFTVECTEATR